MIGRLGRALRVVAINLLVLAAVLIVLEGLASAFLIVRDVTVFAWVAQPYTQYDAELGWVNRPGVRIPDMFGPGVGVETNAQGFRTAHDVAPRVAPGRLRVVCAGDSFTFGDGVDNAHTWCEQLAAHDPRIEPVNLGEGGYGVDQAYLRYVRDTRGVEHHALVLAFITDDFTRMQEPVYLGFGKPVLALDEGRLRTGNVPVPRVASSHPWLIAIPRAFADTRLAALARRAANKVKPENPAARDARDGASRQLLEAIVADLKRVTAERSSALVLAYLPAVYELGGTGPAVWTRFIGEIAARQQVPLVDVMTEFRSRPWTRDLFLWEGTAAGHYSNAGHAAVADMIASRLGSVLPQP